MSLTLEERVAILEKTVAEYEDSREFSDQIKGVHRRLIEFEKETGRRFDRIDRRFDTLESRFDTLESRFDTLEARVDVLEAKVDAIVPAVARILQEEIAKLKT